MVRAVRLQSNGRKKVETMAMGQDSIVDFRSNISAKRVDFQARQQELVF